MPVVRDKTTDEIIAERNMLREAMQEVDMLGNGLERGGDMVSAYASLMRCGAIARRALNQLD